MIKDGVLHYDLGDDSLTFINKSRDAKYTMNTGLTLLSLNNKKEIVAIQLMGANKNFNIGKEILENLEKAKIEFHYHKDNKMLIINILLYYNKKEPIRMISQITLTSDLAEQNRRTYATSCA